MKKLNIVVFVYLLGLVFSVSVIYAEMAKEGSGDYRSAKSGTREILAMGKERLQLNWSHVGLVMDAPENSPFQNATFRTIGTVHGINGVYEGPGFVEWTLPNGDKIYAEVEVKGSREKGATTTGKFVGGTGSCAGIQGTIQIKSGPKIKPAKKDIFQGSTVGKVSWKLP